MKMREEKKKRREKHTYTPRSLGEPQIAQL